eukprot:CAMPEP_0202913268 /NCGR_PEP_ID=MMETSP1392-20130828/60038_1 /ASSEMBLY_ACC=CAM_ASM_000868 /TAXON_ID=225041 /ORGANISM="Chlamydomonas chlamydogama, Strain SAG 11-48b" /LENGTH=96 /DNA_ID=CAMNT_0049604475 /DNA_START=32 /DNA_END=318 /DNA_ORIENTATION=-
MTSPMCSSRCDMHASGTMCPPSGPDSPVQYVCVGCIYIQSCIATSSTQHVPPRCCTQQHTTLTTISRPICHTASRPPDRATRQANAPALPHEQQGG